MYNQYMYTILIRKSAKVNTNIYKNQSILLSIHGGLVLSVFLTFYAEKDFLC